MVSAPNDVSAIYVAKYNRFVDTILGRINRILKDKYDPVTVKLVNPTTTNKNKNKTTSSKKSSSKKSKRRKSSKSKSKHARTTPQMAMAPRNEDGIQEAAVNVSSSTEPMFTEEPKVGVTTLSPPPQTEASPTSIAPELATRLVSNEVSATSSNRGSGTSTSSKRKKNKTRAPTKTGTKTRKPAASSNKVKAQATTAAPVKKPRSKAKATLYGLSSLKRSGDVSVNMMSDHTTIRTKFNLGPLVLKVEKEFGRSTRKEVRSATATTAEMSGRLSLRVYHGGAATLHSIRVLQPKQMRIESADDHDRTREFVWKRSSHIAHLVSQKLSSATRSMLRPPPGGFPASPAA